ncbi:hypothetical protein PIB30_046363 [Stylosanthes scabra]|uniref:Uncharacterized protein n=1 Tax=Stylosanthes scabra TaxID=79078 RepID=A0ABU6YDT3_9FABA|nr:hypothetical protein [Stylosanthes scabra]
MRVVGIEFLFPKSPSLLQSDDYSSLPHRFILAPFAFLGHFQSNSNLSRPETLEQTHHDWRWSQRSNNWACTNSLGTMLSPGPNALIPVITVVNLVPQGTRPYASRGVRIALRA